MRTEQLYSVPCPHRVGVRPLEGSHLSMVYSQQAAVNQNDFLSASARLAVAAQLLDQGETHADISATESSGGLYSTARSGNSSLPVNAATLFQNSLHASRSNMPTLTVAEPVVGGALSVGSDALSNEYSSAPESTSNCNRTLLPNSTCTYSCQGHPSILPTATASGGRNEAREARSRPLVGLGTPVRSPLQSSSLSSKLMKLLKKGKLADKQESTSGAQAVRKSNVQSKLTGELQREGTQNELESLETTVSCNLTSSDADNCRRLQVSDCSQSSFCSSLSRRQPRGSSNPAASFSAVSRVEPTQSAINQTSMLHSGIFSSSDPNSSPNVEQSQVYTNESGCFESMVVQSAHPSICEAKCTALCSNTEPTLTVENASHSNTDDYTVALAPESLLHRSGSENSAQVFNQYGSQEHPQLMLCHSDEIKRTTFSNSYSDPIASEVYSTSQSVLPCSYRMPDMSSAAVIDSTRPAVPCGSSQSHSVLKPQWKEATDPVSGRKVYIDSATGNCLSQKPASLTHLAGAQQSYEMDSTAGREVLLGKRTHTLHSHASTLSQCSSSSLGAPPLRAAPHLSHNFSPLLPRPKQQRTSFSRDNRTDVSLTQSSISSLVAEHVTSCSSECAVDSKWRNDDELSQLRMSQMNEPSSVARLLENWENPTFQPGHEVRKTNY